MLQVSNRIGFGANDDYVIVEAFESAVDTTGASSYSILWNYGIQPGLIILGVVGRATANRTISSVTVTPSSGTGVALTQAVANATAVCPSGIFYAQTTQTGATATVDIVFDGAMTYAGIYGAVIRRKNSLFPELGSTFSATSGDPISATYEHIEGTLSLIMAVQQNATVSSTAWSDVTFSGDVTAGARIFSHAYIHEEAYSATKTPSCDFNATPTSPTFVGANFF